MKKYNIQIKIGAYQKCLGTWVIVIFSFVLYLLNMICLNFIIQIPYHTHNRSTFEYSSWANLCSPSLECTVNLRLLKRQTCVIICIFEFWHNLGTVLCINFSRQGHQIELIVVGINS